MSLFLQWDWCALIIYMEILNSVFLRFSVHRTKLMKTSNVFRAWGYKISNLENTVQACWWIEREEKHSFSFWLMSFRTRPQKDNFELFFAKKATIRIEHSCVDEYAHTPFSLTTSKCLQKIFFLAKFSVAICRCWHFLFNLVTQTLLFNSTSIATVRDLFYCS